MTGGAAEAGAYVMLLAVLQFDLIIRDSRSLKDKRSVVSSVKDRLHREFLASVAEVALQDRLNVARLGLAIVGSDGRHLGQVLDRVCARLQGMHEAELGGVTRQILAATGEDAAEYADPDRPDPALAAEMLRRAGEEPLT